MARYFRYYGKKRGDRRTGSSTMGRAGEMIFYAVFLLLGCGAGAMLFSFLVIPQWRVNHEFVEHTCVVLEKRVAEKRDEDGTMYRPEFHIQYQVGGETYRAWTYDVHMAYSSSRRGAQETLARFTKTEDPQHAVEYPCWYDPINPGKAVLVRGASWWIWLIFIVPASFILIGGAGLIYRVLRLGKSAERRAVMVQRGPGRDLFDVRSKADREFPNIPLGTDITNSPGTTLAYRLPIATSPGWKLFGTLMACLFWNGIVSVFVVIAVRGHLDNDPDWFLTLFLLPFVAVGIALIFFFIRQLLVTTGVGPTMVEISEYPLMPGKRYRLFVSQAGRLTISSLHVWLVCEERATYRQGTDTRTETREVYRQAVYCREGFEVRRGLPFEAKCELIVPRGAMHSFKADHNEIQWSLVVAGNVARWPDYRRAFPVIIHPSNERSGA